jgi:ATP adenylyltransferase
MKQMWAPWRIEYILGEKVVGCIFCDKIQEEQDAENLILHRGEHCFVIMNRYPYTNGHLMVAPYVHVDSPTRLDAATQAELMALTNRCLEVLAEAMHPQGFNLGMNIGAPAGAGIKDHIHMHIVPRWVSDTNFMPVFCDTRIIPEGLAQTYEKLKPLFAARLTRG